MVRGLAVDLIMVAAALAGLSQYARNWKRKRKEVKVLARFVGGPLDNKTKYVLPNATYVYRNPALPNPILYKHTGYNIYEVVGDVMEGGN